MAHERDACIYGHHSGFTQLRDGPGVGSYSTALLTPLQGSKSVNHCYVHASPPYSVHPWCIGAPVRGFSLPTLILHPSPSPGYPHPLQAATQRQGLSCASSWEPPKTCARLLTRAT